MKNKPVSIAQAVEDPPAFGRDFCDRVFAEVDTNYWNLLPSLEAIVAIMDGIISIQYLVNLEGQRDGHGIRKRGCSCGGIAL